MQQLSVKWALIGRSNNPCRIHSRLWGDEIFPVGLRTVPDKGYSMYSEVLVQNELIMLVFRYREQYARRVRTARDFTSIVRLLL